MNSAHPASRDGIAIIGLAGRFPGARDIDAFWRHLLHGVESVSAFTAAANRDPQQRVAYIVPVPAKEPIRPGEVQRELWSELRDFLGAMLPTRMVPELFVALPALPRLPSGKVDPRAWPAPEVHRQSPAREAAVAPATATEKILAAIWGEVLDVAEVSATDNFFALGGHSLLAIRVVARVRSAFQIELAMKHLFETPTLAAFASLVEDQLREPIAALSDEEARKAIAPAIAASTALPP